MCNGVLAKLTECRRSDRELFDLCTDVNKVNISEFGNKVCQKSVAYHNSVRKQVNHEWMLKLRGSNFMELKKCAADKNSQDIYVYENLPIIACKTNCEYGIVNGEEFTVKSFDDKHVIINADKNISIKTNDLTKIFYPAYCLTVHRAQGSTFEGSFSIFEWELMDERLKYVALSRATKKSNINFAS